MLPVPAGDVAAHLPSFATAAAAFPRRAAAAAPAASLLPAVPLLEVPAAAAASLRRALAPPGQTGSPAAAGRVAIQGGPVLMLLDFFVRAQTQICA